MPSGMTPNFVLQFSPIKIVNPENVDQLQLILLAPYALESLRIVIGVGLPLPVVPNLPVGDFPPARFLLRLKCQSGHRRFSHLKKFGVAKLPLLELAPDALGVGVPHRSEPVVMDFTAAANGVHFSRD